MSLRSAEGGEAISIQFPLSPTVYFSEWWEIAAFSRPHIQCFHNMGPSKKLPFLVIPAKAGIYNSLFLIDSA
jgi:hypothetical protein